MHVKFQTKNLKCISEQLYWGEILGIKYKSTVQGLDNFVIKAQNYTATPAYKLFIKADALRLANHFKESIKHYLNSILIDRTNYRAYMGLGISYKAEENYEKAIKALEKARELSSYTPQIHYELGLCYILTGRFCEAIQSLHKSISMDKENLNAQLQLAVAHEFIEEYDMAMLIYHTIIERNPGFLAAYNHLSALYMNLGEYKAAGTVFSQILKVNPNFHKAYLGLAICYDKISNRQRAIHYYKTFLDKKPHSHHGEKIKKRIAKLKNRISVSENDNRSFAVV